MRLGSARRKSRSFFRRLICLGAVVQWSVSASAGDTAAFDAAGAAPVRQEQMADATPRQDMLAAATPAPVPAAPAVARTRFVVGLDRKVDVQVFALANPNRVVVELPDVKLLLPDLDAKAKGLITSFRGGLAAPGRTRIVLDVSKPVVVESSKVEKDQAGIYRLTLDVLPADAALKPRSKALTPPSALGASDIQPPLPKRAESPKARAARAFKPIIVLDPGHGGMDSGATKWGTQEKKVVLDFAHELRDQLEKTGRYKILMTRDKDVFIELDERRAYAERNNANLFIAIHADYAGTRARGATIFSLRDGVAKSLLRSTKNTVGDTVLSAKDADTIKQATGDVDTVRDILADLAERDVELTQERSSVFAKTVIEEMGENTPMRHEPDQQAAFRVLKTAQFPSVLIELAYVSNKQDANNLNSSEWRERVADSIVTAVDNYFGNQLARLPM